MLFQYNFTSEMLEDETLDGDYQNKNIQFNGRQGMMDLEERLKKTVKDAGEVIPVYGGYEIRVLKPTLFPWYSVVKLLIETGQEIWVSEKGKEICITSEPKV
jgi:hypothetical protein